MKETPEKQLALDFVLATYTNPVLEECYRIKAATPRKEAGTEQ